jgi:predicted transcriptional regulator YheO
MKKMKYKKRNDIPEHVAAYLPVCDGIATLFQPYVEVVLHDLKTETVAYIANNFSKRKIGEASLMQEIEFEPSDNVIGPYEKVNWDGCPIKSISIILRAKEKPVAVMCINTDISHFNSALRILETLAAVPKDSDKSTALFKEDWHERINEYINAWVRERGTAIAVMNRSAKKHLILDLARDGALGGKNAATYIARVLGLGRATVYNYLREDSGSSPTGS